MSFEVSRVTASGITVKTIYGPEDVAPGYAQQVAAGKPPFLRGAYEEMYRSRPWRIFQLSGYGNPEDEGERIRFLLARGETGFIMEHDRNTADHLYDVDHPEVVARKEDVGLVGAVILSVRDYVTVLDGVDVGAVYAHPGGGVVQHAPFALCAYWNVARQRNVSLANLSGTGQADFFLTYVGCFSKQQVPTAAGLRLNVDTIEFCLRHLPHWTPVSIAGYNGADSGLNAYQELGSVMANAVEYLDEIHRRGDVDVVEAAAAVGGVSFRVGMDLFEDIAKLRAARVMWCEVLRQRYGITDARASRLRIHALTAGSRMTYQQPLNNISRGTLMGLAGVLGGAQSLGISGYDEAVSIPSEHAHQMSVRIQQILQNEAGLTSVVDPLGGSYFVESLTESIRSQAWDFFDEIQRRGGFLSVIDSGWLFEEALKNTLQEMEDLEEGRRRVVGLNFADSDTGSFEIEGFKGSTDAWERGMDRLSTLRVGRERGRHNDAMRELRNVCASSTNVMPAMMEAVAAEATIGEIGEVFRSVFGVWVPPVSV
jgi:methylmalonyl-CoA mutase, N-terminal domain